MISWHKLNFFTLATVKTIGIFTSPIVFRRVLHPRGISMD